MLSNNGEKIQMEFLVPKTPIPWYFQHVKFHSDTNLMTMEY